MGLGGRPLDLTGERDERLSALSTTGVTYFSAGGNVLVYLSTFGPNTFNLEILDRNGGLLRTIGEQGSYYTPRFSHDGKKLALEVHNSSGTGDIEIYDLERGQFSRLTFEPSQHHDSPLWSPDDQFLIYRTAGSILRKPAGTAGATVPIDLPPRASPTDWSIDGEWLLYQAREDPLEDWDLAAYSLKDGTTQSYLAEPHDEGQAVFSLDGKWVAYASDETGRLEIYLRPFPLSPGKWQLSNNGGLAPRWRGDGKELFYLALDGTVMSVPMALGTAFPGATPQALFRSQVRIGGFDLSESVSSFIYYDVSQDGEQFLLVNRPGGGDRFSVILNWQTLIE